ncbi:MAG: T9SS type A sorting domain-containing protein [Bacteroidota bacterium]
MAINKFYVLFILLLPLLLPKLAAQMVVWEEDFETCGNTVNCSGDRYTSANDFFGGASDYFGRIRSDEDFYLTDATNGNNIQVVSGGYSGQNGDYFYAAEDLDDTNPLEGNADAVGFKDITFTNIPIIGGTNMEFRGLFARGETNICGANSVYDALDFVELYYNVDGTGEVKALCFSANLECQDDEFNEALHNDPNCDRDGSDGLPLTNIFTEYTFAIPTGSNLDIRIRVSMDSGSEEFAFDYFRVFSDSPILPVELSKFKGYATPQGNELIWETASEQDNDHFLVERSEDAKQFTPIGKLKGAGTTLEPQQYRFLDEAVSIKSTVYYRLKQVDFDGAFEYSKIVAIESSKLENPTIQVYPNPVSNQLRFNFPKSFSEHTTLRICNTLGQPIRVIPLHSTSTMLELDVSSWQKGIYYIHVQTDQKPQTIQKIIVH